jgi:signal transduction histidine kinase
MLTIRDVSKLHDLEQAEAKNNYLNMLNSTVTHELMTPLNCILTFANSIYNALPKGEIKNQSKLIIHSTSLMRLQVRDLLDRTYAEKGTLNFNLQANSLKQIIKEVCNLMQP